MNVNVIITWLVREKVIQPQSYFSMQQIKFKFLLSATLIIMILPLLTTRTMFFFYLFFFLFLFVCCYCLHSFEIAVEGRYGFYLISLQMYTEMWILLRESFLVSVVIRYLFLFACCITSIVCILFIIVIVLSYTR